MKRDEDKKFYVTFAYLVGEENLVDQDSGERYHDEGDIRTYSSICGIGADSLTEATEYFEKQYPNVLATKQIKIEMRQMDKKYIHAKRTLTEERLFKVQEDEIETKASISSSIDEIDKY